MAVREMAEVGHEGGDGLLRLGAQDVDPLPAPRVAEPLLLSLWYWRLMGEESGRYCGGSGYTRGLCVATQMSQCNLKGEMGSTPTPGPLGIAGSHHF